jgi:hypothetical protein
MKRLLAATTVLAGTMAAATASMTAFPATAETGSMVLIGVGLVLTASLARQKLRSRH